MKKVLSLLLVVVMIFGLAACGGGGGSEEAEKVEKVTIGLTSWPTSLDPAALMGKQNTPWLAQVYDTLLYCNNDGTVSSYICESWEMLDELTAEFKLKEGITFHNGDPLTAYDVAYSYDRVLNDETGYINANIPGVVATVADIEVIDDLTLRMSSAEPDPIFFDRLAARLGVWIVPQNYLEEVGTDVFGTQPMGTGPYKVDSISPESMMLSYYEGYYDEAPLAPVVEYRYISEETALVTAMVNGDIDMVPYLSTTAADLMSGYDNINVFNVADSTSHLLRFNTKTGPTSDKLLRQALSLAIDRQLLVDSLWGDYAWVPNGYHYEEFGRYYIDDYPAYEYNVDKAKELVAQSSYDGEEFTFQVVPGYYAMGVEAAEAIVDMWSEIGVNCKIEYVEAIKTKTITGVANWSNGLRFSDPLGGLWVLWGEGTGPQKDLWDAPERFNELGNLMEVETDDAKRTEYYREMTQIWDDEMIGTILYCPNAMWAVRDGLAWDYAAGRAMNIRAGYLTQE